MKRSYIMVPLIIILLIALITASFNFPKEDFSSFNTQWNGCSALRVLVKNEHPVSDIFDVNDLKGKEHGAILLLNPNKAVGFSQEEIDTFKSFVEGGGSLLIANDFGNANNLLDGLGIGGAVRFDGSLLMDNYSNWAGAEYPSIYTFSNSSVTTGTGTLDFNYATVLDVASQRSNTGNMASAAPISNLTVLARSSPASYLVSDLSSGTTTSNATHGEMPVLASLSYGEGKIILCSDPSVFINYMIGRADNKQLFENIIANLTNNDPQATVFFDEAHRVEKPLLTIAYERLNSDETLKYVTTVLIIGTFGALLTATRMRRSEGRGADQKQVQITTDAMLQDILTEHPAWSGRQLKRLLQSTRVRKRRD